MAGCSGTGSADHITVTEVVEEEPSETVLEEKLEVEEPEEVTDNKEEIEAESEPEEEPLVFTQDEYVTYGVYEQDNNLDNGPEPIEWRVCYVDDEKALLMSKYILDCRQFHSFEDNYTEGSYGILVTDYDRSDLKKWLNEDFYNSAFPEENILIDSPNGENQGKVFVISYYDAIEYIPCTEATDDTLHDCIDYYYEIFKLNPTEYAYQQSVINGAYWDYSAYVLYSPDISFGNPEYCPTWYMRDCPAEIANALYGPVVMSGHFRKWGYDGVGGGMGYQGIVPFIWVKVQP